MTLAAARWLVIVLGVLSAGVALGHPPVASSGVLKVQRDGTLELSVHHDVLAFVLNDTSQLVPDEPMNALLDRPQEAELARLIEAAGRRAVALTAVHAGETRVELRLRSYPTAEAVLQWARAHEPRLPVKMDYVLEGTLGLESRSVTVEFPEILDPVVLTVDVAGREAQVVLVRPGQVSEVIDVSIPVVDAAAGEPEKTAGARLTWRGVLDFVVLGFEHILPSGLDHVLFVIALCVLDLRMRPILTQVTLFTVAHSVTLAWASMGMPILPDGVIEPVIAASIALVAIENVWSKTMHVWRPVVVFVFGLVHGLGFAGAFAEATGGEVTLGAVLWFNVGVELGQLAVVGLVVLAIGWWRERDWFRARVVIPISVVIAVMGVYWAIERVLGL